MLCDCQVKEKTVQNKQPIQEIQVITGVAKWLRSDGWRLRTISIPHGQGLDYRAHKNEVISNVHHGTLPSDDVKLSHQGPDIVATRGSELWRIECKGLGNVAPATLKNNFDRVVASAVSYYDQKGMRVGLALPEAYRKHIIHKLPRSLREAINMWIFLYVVDEEIYVWGPDEDMVL
jgi:hypothetical protein